MTSTPTACPKCGRLVDFCDHREIVATQLAEPVAVCADVDCSVEHPTGKPSQPDTVTARDAAAEILGYHGCSSGDCPHEKQSECFAALVEAGYDAGHARALEEMGAEVERLKAVREAFKLYGTTDCAECDSGRVTMFIANDKCVSCAPHTYEREDVVEKYNSLREQLAACELRAGEYEKALEDTIYDSERLEQGQYAVDKVEAVLAKHRRGGES